MESVFMINQAVKASLLYMIQYGTGLLVLHRGIKVNYTRKINHFFLFFLPVYIDRVFAYEDSFGLFSLSSAFAVASLLLYIRPLRERVPVIATMFRSFDRPEDRPHTLLWLSTQITAGFLVIIPMIILFARYDLLDLIFIPIVVNGIGDGLAEPVGIRFGRHTYRAYALFTRKRYVRSIEGSACIFLTSIIALSVYHACFSPLQFVIALTCFPAVMTLAEAFSPHTWDTPFLFLTGYLSLFVIATL